MIVVAKDEGRTTEFICRGIASGRIVIPRSPYRFTKPIGIGKGLRTKVNASIGTSSDIVDVEMELEKAHMAEKTGADTLMELSTGGDFHEIRRRVVEATSLSVGVFPYTRPSSRPLESTEPGWTCRRMISSGSLRSRPG